MKARRLKPAQKDGFAAEISKHLGVDYQEIASARMFTIMVSDEVRALAAAGVQFELHTHTHVTPSEAGYFDEEIAANRTAIEQMTGVAARHFCYPSGRYRPEFLPWLQGKQVVSATTCDPGLASIHSNPLLLPRFVDVNGVTPVEFEGWISGAASFLSHHGARGDRGGLVHSVHRCRHQSCSIARGIHVPMGCQAGIRLRRMEEPVNAIKL
jgi:hypothetical protein